MHIKDKLFLVVSLFFDCFALHLNENNPPLPPVSTLNRRKKKADDPYASNHSFYSRPLDLLSMAGGIND